MGRLTTHVLDTSTGRPAADVGVCLYALTADGGRRLVADRRTDGDGRVPGAILEGEALVAGTYELVFAVGDHFRAAGIDLADPPFLDEVVLRFGVADPSRHWHVPLLVTPWSYATYRGS